MYTRTCAFNACRDPNALVFWPLQSQDEVLDSQPLSGSVWGGLGLRVYG